MPPSWHLLTVPKLDPGNFEYHIYAKYLICIFSALQYLQLAWQMRRGQKASFEGRSLWSVVDIGPHPNHTPILAHCIFGNCAGSMGTIRKIALVFLAVTMVSKLLLSDIGLVCVSIYALWSSKKLHEILMTGSKVIIPVITRLVKNLDFKKENTLKNTLFAYALQNHSLDWTCWKWFSPLHLEYSSWEKLDQLRPVLQETSCNVINIIF